MTGVNIRWQSYQQSLQFRCGQLFHRQLLTVSCVHAFCRNKNIICVHMHTHGMRVGVVCVWMSEWEEKESIKQQASLLKKKWGQSCDKALDNTKVKYKCHWFKSHPWNMIAFWTTCPNSDHLLFQHEAPTAIPKKEKWLTF